MDVRLHIREEEMRLWNLKDEVSGWVDVWIGWLVDVWM